LRPLSSFGSSSPGWGSGGGRPTPTRCQARKQRPGLLRRKPPPPKGRPADLAVIPQTCSGPASSRCSRPKTFLPTIPWFNPSMAGRQKMAGSPTCWRLGRNSRSIWCGGLAKSVMFDASQKCEPCNPFMPRKRTGGKTQPHWLPGAAPGPLFRRTNTLFLGSTGGGHARHGRAPMRAGGMPGPWRHGGCRGPGPACRAWAAGMGNGRRTSVAGMAGGGGHWRVPWGRMPGDSAGGAGAMIPIAANQGKWRLQAVR